MGMGSFTYNLLLLVHILLAIVGFGGVMLNGVYAAKAQALPPDRALAVMEVNSFVSVKVAERVIYLVPLAGISLVLVADGAIEWSDTWVWLSMVLFVVAIAISHAIVLPTAKEMLTLQREIVESPPAGGPPPQAERLAQLGPKIGGASMVLDLLLVAILVLMIWKP